MLLLFLSLLPFAVSSLFPCAFSRCFPLRSVLRRSSCHGDVGVCVWPRARTLNCRFGAWLCVLQRYDFSATILVGLGPIQRRCRRAAILLLVFPIRRLVRSCGITFRVHKMARQGGGVASPLSPVAAFCCVCCENEISGPPESSPE